MNISTTVSIFIALLFMLSFLAIFITLLVKQPKKYLENEAHDIIISSFSTMNFIPFESTSNYTESNLGLTGRLILDCYTGTCPVKYYYDSSSESYTYKYEDLIDYNCSEQCTHIKKGQCLCDDTYDGKIGKCSKKYNDNYEDGKYCYADNVIYFWKGKKYEISKKEVFTYYKNAVLKDEKCPTGTKFCGIIDDKENKLCISSTSSCPINYFSENKLNEHKNHSTVIIGNKTFYYTFDDDITQNKKIIAGLVVDSDLYLNYDNAQNIIIDKYTISGLLEDNKNLYKEIDLGFDPYQTENIDEKGNSYLRIYYKESINLTELWTKIEKYKNNIKLNEEKIKPINKNIKVTSICGLIAYGFAFLTLIFLCAGINEKKLYGTFVGIFAILMLVSLIFACINISKFRGLKKLDHNNDNIETSRKLNLSFVILGFSFFPFIIFLNFLLSNNKCNSCCCYISKGVKKKKKRKIIGLIPQNIDIAINKSTENKQEIHYESLTNINK